jgi:hypothetical protein
MNSGLAYEINGESFMDASASEHCWHGERVLYTRTKNLFSCSRSEQLSDAVASTPLVVARVAHGRSGVWTEIG